ncbi:hypothetical protein Tco_0153029 [Tanacetum coccineum]
MDDPNITMKEYIRLEEEKGRRPGKVFNWETATYGKIWDNEDVHDLRSVETEFPAIALNNEIVDTAYPNPMDTAYDLLDVIQSLFFSTVNTAYSLNEYSVFDTGINTAYPGVWIRHIDFLYSI